MKTIVAIATPQTNGPIGIIRISGPNAFPLLSRHFRVSNPHATFQARELVYGFFCDSNGNKLDEMLAVKFPSPHSFTGDDVVELHGHGNLLLLQKILSELLQAVDLDVELAQPGEFTLRAFQNNKIDLIQAEAIHELISAQSEASLKSSLSNLSGEFSKLVSEMREKLTLALMLVESSFEFPEEDIQTYDRFALNEYIQDLKKILQTLLAAFRTSQLSDQGISVALVGRPNVGKSSLLNALLQEEKAIVTALPGTTRDVVEGTISYAGFRFILRDTAGIHSTDDAIENMGIEKSRQWLAKAEIVLLISDNPDDHFEEFKDLLKGRNHIYLILNKCDLFDFSVTPSETHFDNVISAKARINLDNILQIFNKYIENEKYVHISVHINQRQHHLLSRALQNLDGISALLERSHIPEELLAEELRACTAILREITGEISSDDVLGEIFSRFCIGK